MNRFEAMKDWIDGSAIDELFVPTKRISDNGMLLRIFADFILQQKINGIFLFIYSSI